MSNKESHSFLILKKNNMVQQLTRQETKDEVLKEYGLFRVEYKTNFPDYYVGKSYDTMKDIEPDDKSMKDVMEKERMSNRNIKGELKKLWTGIQFYDDIGDDTTDMKIKYELLKEEYRQTQEP